MEDVMKTELESEVDKVCERLATRYPYQFQKPDFFEFNPAFGDGWLPLFERLCENVDRALDACDKAQFRWAQVKEKFGGLRAYWEFGNSDEERATFRKSPAGQEVIRLIEAASQEADRTCDVCGRTPASLGRLHEGGRVLTLCHEHIGERTSCIRVED
jgi:hypothetical protein